MKIISCLYSFEIWKPVVQTDFFLILNEKEKQISKKDIKLGLEESPKGTLNKNSKVDDDDDDRIKGLQDKLDKLISDGAANNLTEKSNISDKILIYVIVGFLVLIIIFLLQNQQK